MASSNLVGCHLLTTKRRLTWRGALTSVRRPRFVFVQVLDPVSTPTCVFLLHCSQNRDTLSRRNLRTNTKMRLKELLKKKQAGEKIESPKERAPAKVINPVPDQQPCATPLVRLQAGQ